MLLSISPFITVNICFMYLGAYILGAYIFKIVISSRIDPFIILKNPSLSLVTVFGIKSILSDISIAVPAFFSCPYSWNIFFQPLTFSFCVSLDLK